MKETELQNLILDYLNCLPGCFAWRNNNTGLWDPVKKIYRPLRGHSHKGVSDILGCINGRSLCVEVKSKCKRPTPEQDAFLDIIERIGGIALWCDSWEVFKKKWDTANGSKNKLLG